MFILTIFSYTGKPYTGNVCISGNEYLSERNAFMKNEGNGVYTYYGDLFSQSEYVCIITPDYKTVVAQNNETIILEKSEKIFPKRKVYPSEKTFKPQTE